MMSTSPALSPNYTVSNHGCAKDIAWRAMSWNTVEHLEGRSCPAQTAVNVLPVSYQVSKNNGGVVDGPLYYCIGHVGSLKTCT